MLPLRSDVHNAPLHGARVLIVEDSLEHGSALCRMLRQEGLEVLWIERGAEAEQWLSRWQPDLILLDLSLPDVDSMALCRRLCTDHSLPVIVLTLDESPDEHVAALACGAADVVTRRCPSRLLLRRMTNAWARARQDTERQVKIQQLATYVPRVAFDAHPTAPQRVVATLLFSDLRGFTRVSFSQDAAEVFETINQILALQIGSVQGAGGYVDGFSGDGMLALFEGPSGPLRACQAAASILALAEQTAIGPWQQLPVGLGIHAGEVMRGDLGVQKRRVFTVLGSPVNIAARLCGVASAREAVVSQDIVDAMPAHSGFSFRSPRTIRLKGIPDLFPVQSLA
jgi:adenylate cyclase